ncbi:MAG: aminoacyl-tRNA hydrolase [Deltaproteobacteria bacterium]|nr:aminoacyl-tRNA hydrolase [Deltaproteobacteria bacterium]
MSTDLRIGPNLTIPGSELTVTATTSSGPGGQNVNKVATKVELRFDLAGSTVLAPAVKARLRALVANRLDADGQLIITSQATRNRIRNLVDARDKLAALVREALVPPRPRVATKPTRASKARRVADKRLQGEKKRGRGGPIERD